MVPDAGVPTAAAAGVDSLAVAVATAVAVIAIAAMEAIGVEMTAMPTKRSQSAGEQ